MQSWGQLVHPSSRRFSTSWSQPVPLMQPAPLLGGLGGWRETAGQDKPVQNVSGQKGGFLSPGPHSLPEHTLQAAVGAASPTPPGGSGPAGASALPFLCGVSRWTSGMGWSG